MPISFDVFSGSFSYPCKCGRIVRRPVADLVPGGFDYCGCGKLELVFDRAQVNQHRELAGLDQLED